MKIWFHAYQLQPLRDLNSQTQGPRSGMLFKVSFESDLVGYADLHPWPELGDAPLSVHLEAVRYGRATPLLERCWALAAIDAKARRNNQSLIGNSDIGLSHFHGTQNWRQGYEQGYRHFKFKMGRDLQAETDFLKRFVTEYFRKGTPQVRLDFNNSLDVNTFKSWLDANLNWLKPYLEFVEDPFLYEGKEWNRIQEQYKIALAADWVEHWERVEPQSIQVAILKPTHRNPDALLQQFEQTPVRFLVTHAMGHTLSQMVAIYFDLQLRKRFGERVLVGGLQMRDMYQPDDFANRVVYEGPRSRIIKSGSGFGFKDILEKLDWKSIGEI